MESLEEVTNNAPYAQQTKPVQSDFLFVDATQAKTSRQGRRNARSFVMQKARRERPWSTSKLVARFRKSSESASPRSAGTPDSLLTPTTTTPSPPIASTKTDYFSFAKRQANALMRRCICPECQIFLCSPGQRFCSRCQCLKHGSTINDPSNSLFDPFQTSSVEIDASISEILEHFVSKMAPGVIAVDVRHQSTLMKSDWFGTAMSNPGFMHSLLCTAALHRYIVNRGSMDTILYHRAQAITAVNKAISNPDSNVGISDANIGAVFNLLTVEEALLSPFFQQEKLDEDHPNQRAIHMDGLRQMVQLRGGLTGIKSNRILQAFILWHSTAHAIASFEVPNHTTLNFVSSASYPRHPPGYQPNFSHHLTEYCRYAGVTNSLLDLVDSVLVLTADLNAWFGNPSSLLDPLDIQNFACILQCMLLTWLREHENIITPLEDALCVALLIFTIRTTEALQRRADVHLLHFTASKRLEKALNCTARSEWQYCPDLLLWILSVGAVSAESSAESSWFDYQTSLACAEFGIHSAEMLLQKLHLCGWVAYKLNQGVCDLWDRIIQVRLKPWLQSPLTAIDTNTSVGPLQHHVGDPAVMEWENMDWTNLAFGPDVPNAFVQGCFSSNVMGADAWPGLNGATN